MAVHGLSLARSRLEAGSFLHRIVRSFPPTATDQCASLPLYRFIQMLRKTLFKAHVLVYNQGQPEEGVYTLFVQVRTAAVGVRAAVVSATAEHPSAAFLFLERCQPLLQRVPPPAR